MAAARDSSTRAFVADDLALIDSHDVNTSHYPALFDSDVYSGYASLEPATFWQDPTALPTGDDSDDDIDDRDAMPDIQRGSLFEPEAVGTTYSDLTHGDVSSQQQQQSETSASALSLSRSRQHRQPYGDANSFVYGDPAWSSSDFPTRASILEGTHSRQDTPLTQPSLRRSAGQLSQLRSRRSDLQTGLTGANSISSSTIHRPLPLTPELRQTPSEQERDIAVTPAHRMDPDVRHREYAGWAPGTNTTEHQIPTLNALRAMARGHRNGATPDGTTTTGTQTSGRSTAMTTLERRYWAEQERQRRSRALQTGEHDAASRRIQIRDSSWSSSNIVDVNGNPIDTGLNGEMPWPRSIVYNRPATDRYSSMRSDIYDLHRELEETRGSELDLSALNRRARRDMQRYRRLMHPPADVRREELTRGLYDLHRDRHTDVPGNSEPTRKSLEDAIKYLESLRTCDTPEQAFMAAQEGNLIHRGQHPCELGDFIFDSKVVKETPWTSWLTPGTRFSGFQKAVTVSALPYTPYNAANNQSSRNRNHAENQHASRIPTATPNSNPNSSTFRPSWIESAIQRDRHTGASTSNHNSALSGATLPSSLLSSTSHLSASPSALSSHIRTENEDTWPVKVTITSVDYPTGTLTGTMEAMNVPNKTHPPASQPEHSHSSVEQTTITTFLQGEIIDLNKHSLETRGFKADSIIDSTYWRRLEPFKSLDEKDIPGKLTSKAWLTSKIGPEWVLMRWKEKCFVTPSDAGMGLTISGFYYISLHRVTGRIEGLYYDPQSSPYQHLCLEPARPRQSSTYKFQ